MGTVSKCSDLSVNSLKSTVCLSVRSNSLSNRSQSFDDKTFTVHNFSCSSSAAVNRTHLISVIRTCTDFDVRISK